MRYIFILALFTLFCFASSAQLRSSLRTKVIALQADTIRLDTLSISPLGFSLTTVSGKPVDPGFYHVDFASAQLTWNRKQMGNSFSAGDSIVASYRVFPMLFTESVKHKDVSLITRDESGLINAYLYTPSAKSGFDLLKAENLSKSGSISRGITFGNSQDVFVNSSFNLQMAGKLSDDVSILAAITDENLPIQPEGNTQQLQEFDKVFIQLTKDSSRLIAGDYELRRPDSYFMNFFKKNQGGYFTTRFGLNKDPDGPVMRAGLSGAVSKGKFSRNTPVAIEGNQGPYRLVGNNNETFIIVLAGSEKVFIDGHLLVRGAQDDYVIDYNTAELTFTSKKLITKDTRIVVEFEYSEKSYSRSMFFFHDEVESKKMKVKFNFFSEQDSRNQPLLIELDSTRQKIMSEAGDSIQNAFFNTADSVAFTSDQILYQKMDTTTLNGTYTGIFVYSINSDSAYWRVTFSNVGQGKGDYIQEKNAVNGRVFKWVEPVAGIPQGSYAPVALLITPKKQQMITLGGDFSVSPGLITGVELAMSNLDVNLFSTKDKSNDAGYAAKIFVQQTTNFRDTTGWHWRNTGNYEFSNLNFKPIERYRPVEFERDWNIAAGQASRDEHFISFESLLENKAKGFVNYQLRSYQRGAEYSGLMNSLGGNYRTSKWKLLAGGSYLNTSGSSVKTKYLKHAVDLSRTLGPLVAGIKESQENNRYLKPGNDSLQASSFFFQEYSGYLSSKEGASSKALLTYRYREDHVPYQQEFRRATRAEDVNLNLEFLANINHQFKTTTAWRELRITDTTHTTLQPEKTLLNRIDYSGTFLKGGITTSLYYEINTGQELKKEYSYLEVPPGQGVYTWNDYNSNGIRELNEFEIAAFASEANYVKIFIPTNEYIATKGNQFSNVLNVTPAVFVKNKNGKPRFVSLFSNQFSVTLNKKTTDDDLVSSLNPFEQSIDDSSLISTNSALRNTLFFNRTNPRYGLDGTWQKIQNKSFLINGFESRAQTSFSANVRWNFTTEFMFTVNGESGEKENRSEFFSDRSYTIRYQTAEPKLTWQPNAATRVSVSYEYSNKKNVFSESDETSTGNSLNTEARYSAVRSGIFTAKFSIINLRYNGPKNSSLAYEMLEGLSPGQNATWNVSAQRNLGKSMQLSLNYEGRKSSGADVVHVGGMQFRAFF